MRIVIATTSGFHLRHLARELIGLGHHVTYFCYLPTFRTVRDGIPRTFQRSLFFKHQPWSSGALFHHAPTIQRHCVERMLELTDQSVAEDMPPCDIFIGLSGMAIRSAEVARRRYGATIFIDRGGRHVLSQNELISAGGGAPLSDFYIQRELASYKAADYIVLPSSHAITSFLDYGFSATRLLKNPYGVDRSLFSAAPSPELPRKLLFVGGWSYQKGVDVLSAALARLPHCTLTHAGIRVNVPYPTSKRFRALGHIAPRTLPQVFANHHILVLPSRQDGFGMVLLEGLACGLGIVASRITGGPDIREVIEKKSAISLIDSGSVDDLVRGIRHVEGSIETTGRRRSILSDAEKDYFSWRLYARRYAEWMKVALLKPLRSGAMRASIRDA